MDRAREEAHFDRQWHASRHGTLEETSDSEFRAHYEDELDYYAGVVRMECIEEPERAWQGAGAPKRCVIERLEECMAERDIAGLTELRAQGARSALARELAELAGREESAQALREPDVQALIRAWTWGLEGDTPLTVTSEAAGALEAQAARWAHGARLDKAGRVCTSDGTRTVAEHAFEGAGAPETSALARARLKRGAAARLGYGPEEIPHDEPGLDTVRAALAEHTPDGKTLARSRPLHQRLRAAEAAGHDARAALMLEQACAGPCLDVADESTLARVRGAMIEALDPARRAREDCARAVASAVRDALDPPRRGPAAREEATLSPRGVEPELSGLGDAARDAARTEGMGTIDARDIDAAMRSAPRESVPALARALASARHAGGGKGAVEDRREERAGGR